MIEQNLLDEPVFGAWFGDQNNGGEGGEITFGGVDESHYKGEICMKGFRRPFIVDHCSFSRHQ